MPRKRKTVKQILEEAARRLETKGWTGNALCVILKGKICETDILGALNIAALRDVMCRGNHYRERWHLAVTLENYAARAAVARQIAGGPPVKRMRDEVVSLVRCTGELL